MQQSNVEQGAGLTRDVPRNSGQRGVLDEATQGPSLSRLERRVVAFANHDPLRFATSTAVEIAELSGTSEATVTRTARRLGYKGIKEMKRACTSRAKDSPGLAEVLEARLEHSAPGDGTGSPRSITTAVVTSAADLLLRLEDVVDPAELAATVAGMAGAGRVVLYGLGTAYRIAQYVSVELTRTGVPALAINGSGHSNADAVFALREGDYLIVLAPRVVFGDIADFLGAATGRVAGTTVITQDQLPSRVQEVVHRIELPVTHHSAGSESVCAWVICDALVAEVAHNQPAAPIAARADLQHLREHFSRP